MSSHHRVPHRLKWSLVGLLAIVSACGGGTVEAFGPPRDESYEESVVSAGRELYLRTCSSCHGRNGDGGVGPNLRQVWERLTFAEHISVVADGRGGRMPNFGQSLSSADIEAIVVYERVGWSTAE